MALTIYAKNQVARAMLHRGYNFLGAAVLLEQNGGYQYVVLHLICQSLEIILKALLLLKNYDKYLPLLPTRRLRHDLVELATIVSSEYSLRVLRSPLREELSNLNALYKTHFLRYADFRDIIPPKDIHYTRVLYRILACQRLVARQLRQ